MMSIGQFAQKADVGIETIRFYQRRGLLTTPKPATGIRRYGEAAMRQLRFIRSAQTAGFTLEQIKELQILDSGTDRARAHHLATQRLAALDQRIKELKSARAMLKRLADECATTKAGPCPIIVAFES
jgi:MerR family transcriptional regulator, mercuric resistance operon regulatory protein